MQRGRVDQRLTRLGFDAGDLVADVAAGGLERAQFVDLRVKLGERLLEIHIAANGVRHGFSAPRWG